MISTPLNVFQVALHDSSSTTFHFVHPEGAALQIKERDAVKEMLVQLLPRFKRKVNKELEERHRMLSDNPGLLQLYKDLVITQILTAEEFWVQHAPDAVKDKNGVKKPATAASNGQSSGGGSRGAIVQDVGVSGSFLADIKPQADGANGIKYNLTPDIINSIFKTYPAVKRKHLENVPGKMSEQEFWNKFFQSHYFHRDRIHGLGVKDIFTECAKDDDSAIKAQIKAGVTDRVANIAGFSDRTIDENYGTGEENTKSSRKDGSAAPANIVHQSIIKRFNQHSIMVMKASDRPPQPQSQPLDPVAAADASEKAAAEAAKRSRTHLREKLEYTDLEEPPAKKKAPLNLAKVERYLNGPTPATSSSTEYLSISEIGASRTSLRGLLHKWEHSNCQSALSPANAVTAMVDLSPGGALMQTSRGDALIGQCPDSVRADLRQGGLKPPHLSTELAIDLNNFNFKNNARILRKKPILKAGIQISQRAPKKSILNRLRIARRILNLESAGFLVQIYFLSFKSRPLSLSETEIILTFNVNYFGLLKIQLSIFIIFFSETC
jgi:transcription initiation factor TFIIH subunit 1